MTFTAFVLVFGAGAALMALWIDVRFPKLMPHDLRAAMIRLVVAFLAIHVIVALSDRLLSPFPPATELWLLLGAAFALLTVSMLTTIWVLKVCRGMLGGSMR